MQRNNVEEEYDFKHVAATLEAMETRRRRRQQFPVTRDFDLAPAELSSGGSDDDSDGRQSDSTSSLPSDGDGSPSQHLRARQQRGRGRTRKIRLTDSLDLSMSVLKMPSKEQALSSTSADGPMHFKTRDEELALAQGKHFKLDAVGKESKIPRLVQQRRQLHAVTDRTTSTRDKISHQTRSPHASELSREVLSSSNTTARLHHPVSHLPSSRTDLRDEAFTVGESVLALPSATVPETPKSGSLLSSGSVSVSTALAQATMLHCAKAPTRGVSRSGQPNFSKKLDGRNTSTPAAGSASDELDSTSAEERQLLQSLEKLDHRLTTVSAVVRDGGQLQTQSDQVHRLVSSNTKGSHSSCTADEIDEETLRAAAYGGGTHCKLRQPAAASVRSSSVKRAELSTGIHKARVRLGGAFIQDTGRNVDGTGKHKVVVKKDLAHLLI
ncbi:hypothetical protein PRIC2_013795 [Phytophthora ramorum]